MNKVTQEDLDWLAEGELTSSERDELFARLDAENDGWKRCAMALLERQALQRSMDEIFPSAESRLPIDSPGSLLTSVDKKPSPASKQSSEATKSRHWLAATLAGSLMAVLFGAGYWIGGQAVPVAQSPAPPMVPNAGHPVVRSLIDQEPSVVLAVNAAVERVNVVDRQVIALISVQRDNNQLVLPVIESEILSQQFAKLPPPQLPTDLSRKLNRSGFEVQPHRQFLSVHHKDGTNEVLPMNMLDCRYVGDNVF